MIYLRLNFVFFVHFFVSAICFVYSYVSSIYFVRLYMLSLDADCYCIVVPLIYVTYNQLLLFIWFSRQYNFSGEALRMHHLKLLLEVIEMPWFLRNFAGRCRVYFVSGRRFIRFRLYAKSSIRCEILNSVCFVELVFVCVCKIRRFLFFVCKMHYRNNYDWI